MLNAAVRIDPDRTHSLLWVLTATWFGAILVAPAVEWDGVYAFFSLICHQDAGRSWHLAGHPLPVCVRCVSIYAGFFAALSIHLRPRAAFLRLALGAMGFEFLVARVGFDWEPTRALSGLLVGLAAAGFVELGIRQLFERTQARAPAKALEVPR